VLAGIFLTAGLILIGIKNKAKETYYSPPEINLVNSVPAGTVVKFPDIYTVDERKVPQNVKTAVIFLDRTCGSCEYLSIALPKLVRKFPGIIWLYVEKSEDPPIIGNVSIKNLYIVRDSKINLSSIFESKYTPTIFLLDKNNKILWKHRGFIPPYYKRFKEVVSYFDNNNILYLENSTERNLLVGKEFPEITVKSYPDNKELSFPGSFKGKPATIFLFQFSCTECLTAVNAIPNELKQTNKINKIIVFAPFSEKINQDGINFGKEFGFKNMVIGLQSPIIKVTWKDIFSALKGAQNTVYINDYDFSFQDSIGWPGAPVLIELDKNGTVRGVFSLHNASNSELKGFYTHLYKTLLNP